MPRGCRYPVNAQTESILLPPSKAALHANFAIDVQQRIRRFCSYKAAVLHPQSPVVWFTLPGGWAKAAPPYCSGPRGYLTTILTSLSGTTITLTICLPSRSSRIFGSHIACFSSSPRGVPNAV
jgi:hypothetical protein